VGGLYRAKFPEFGPIGRKVEQDRVSGRETGTEMRFAMEGPGFCRARARARVGARAGARVGARAGARVGARARARVGAGPVSLPLIHA